MIKEIRSKLFKILWGRLGRNLIFWVLFIGEWLYAVPIPKGPHPERYVLFRFIMFSLIIGYTYTNNLFLIPKLLVKKRYWLYLFLVLALSYTVAFGIALSFNIMMHRFPGMKIEDVSFITTDVPLSYTWAAMLEGATNYFYFLIEWLATFTMAWYMSEFARQQKLMEQSQKKQLETELSFLKSQMNPHFLFNTLNNLYGLALKKAESTPETILKLSSILRYLLYESEAEKVSFDKEKEIMEAYIALELLRIEKVDYLDVTIACDSEYVVPPLLWLPVLENVFKHATRVISDSYHIEYSFEVSNGTVRIFSRNNYKSLTDTEKNVGGIGLQNLEKRLSLLYPGKYSIKSGANGHYYATEININLA